jgi:ankyrin repeat protein
MFLLLKWCLFFTRRTALHESARNGTLSIFKMLLDAGADREALDDYSVGLSVTEYSVPPCSFLW